MERTVSEAHEVTASSCPGREGCSHLVSLCDIQCMYHSLPLQGICAKAIYDYEAGLCSTTEQCVCVCAYLFHPSFIVVLIQVMRVKSRLTPMTL